MTQLSSLDSSCGVNFHVQVDHATHKEAGDER
jgi:hypothetical protein